MQWRMSVDFHRCFHSCSADVLQMFSADVTWMLSRTSADVHGSRMFRDWFWQFRCVLDAVALFINVYRSRENVCIDKMTNSPLGSCGCVAESCANVWKTMHDAL